MPRLKLLAAVSVIVFLISSCSVFRLADNAKVFNGSQEQLILNGGANDPMRVFKITNKSDSLLLRSASDYVQVDSTDATLRLFVNRLLTTVQDSMSMGVGIAAPQVGILKRIIWVQRFDKEGFPFEEYINPQITVYSDKKQDCREGCLSIPDRSDTTKIRAQDITLTYERLDQSKHIETVSGFTAVIFQHEIDHLDGILYLDHLAEEVGK